MKSFNLRSSVYALSALLAGMLTLHSNEILLDLTFEGGYHGKDLPNGHLPWYSATGSEDLEWTDRGLTLFSADRSSRHLLTHFGGEDPISLAVGESLTLEYEFSLVEPVIDPDKPRGNSIRIGLFSSSPDENRELISNHNHGGIQRTEPGTPFDKYSGYRFDLYPNFEPDRPAHRVLRRNPHPDAALLVLSEAFSPLSAEGGHALEIKDDSRYRGKIVILRVSDDLLRLSHTFESVDNWDAEADTFFVFEESEDIVRSLDTLVFGLNSQVADGLTLHNVKLTLGDPPALPYFVGIKRIETNIYNPSGFPVVPMWRAGNGNGENTVGMTYPLLPSSQHATVWEPQTREEGGYNHYACLIYHGGRFHAMWGNHPKGEDAPGQRVLYSSSDEWGVWSDPVELMEAPGPVLPRDQRGIHLKPDRWVVVDDKLFAIVYVHGAGRYPIAAEVVAGEIVGEIFPFDPIPDRYNLPVFMNNREPSSEAEAWVEKIREWYRTNNQISWWARIDESLGRRGADDATVIESFTYRAKEGETVLMMRDWGTPSNPVHSNRMYVSFNPSTEDLFAPWPTDIPDSPTRSEAIRLPSGHILLIGSQLSIPLDKALYLDRDPLTVSLSLDGYTFDHAYILRTHSKSRYRIPGIRGRNHGFAYSSSIVHGEWLYTLYSISKEDMGITRVRLDDLFYDIENP